MGATRTTDSTRRCRSGQRPRTLRALAALAGVTCAVALLAPRLWATAFAGSTPGGVAPRTSAAGANGLLRGGGRARTATAAGAGDQLADTKALLFDLVDDEAVAQEVLRPEGRPTRGRVDELILQLERLNPSDEPVYSELLDGDWQVKYSGSYAPGLLSSPTRELALFLYGGGFSLGNALSSFVEGFWGQSLGLKLAGKQVRIQAGRDVDASVELEVSGRKETLSYVAELMPLSGRRMSEEIVSVDLPGPLGKREPPLELRRSILVTYLDEELMVVRDESGIPEILVREAPAAPVPAPADADATTVSSAGEPALAAEPQGDDPMSSEAS